MSRMESTTTEMPAAVLDMYVAKIKGADLRAAMLHDMVQACGQVCARYGQPNTSEMVALSAAFGDARAFARQQIAEARDAGLTRDQIDAAANKLGLDGLGIPVGFWLVKPD